MAGGHSLPAPRNRVSAENKSVPIEVHCKIRRERKINLSPLRYEPPSDALELITELLRGETPLPFPGAGEGQGESEPARRLMALAQLHGVTALLANRLLAGSPGDWPGDLLASLREHLHHEAARELVIESELHRLCEALAAAGVRHLLFKGAPLAYTIYPEPHLRTRCDTDLLVPEEQRDAAEAVLREAGYAADQNAAGGELASSERMYTRMLLRDIPHVVDLHWRLNNLQSFARAFDFASLEADVLPVPPLGPAARMPGLVHALLIACLHRSGHLDPPRIVEGTEFTSGNRLIWLYDLHLLAQRLDDRDWARFAMEAGQRGLRAVCLDGLRTAQAHLGTAVPESVLAALAAPGPREIAAGHLRPGRWRRHWLDLRALTGWRARTRLLREWVFPPPAYMLRKYGSTSRFALPWLYLRRVVSGIWRSIGR